MTSAIAFKRSCIRALLLAGLIGLGGESRAQSTEQNGSTAAAREQNAGSTMDRGKMRLKLLINLVENELKEAKLRQSRLTTEASALDQERRKLLDAPSKGTETEKRQIGSIEERLVQIDKEVAEVNRRLPEIGDELAELQARLDEANGVVRPRDVETKADNGIVVDSASRWLDSKRRVQEALVYLGGYNALIDGDFGPRTEAAVRVFQGRRGVERTGTLTDEQEAELLKEADLLRARYGMTTLEDVQNGYRVTYPSGLLPESSRIENGGRRYVSKNGEGELVLTSSEDGAVSSNDFLALYDELLVDYEVQYRRKRGDWFVVAGLLDEGRIVYDTARLDGDRIIRAKLSYPSEWRDLWSPFAVIMFNTFEALSAGQS